MQQQSKLRIVLAIAAKDAVEGLRNKNTLSVIITVLFMVLVYRYLPLVTGDAKATRIFIYDAAGSETFTDLEYSETMDVHVSPSLAALERRIGDGSMPELGLVIPADFESVLAQGEAPVLKGYAASWVTAEQAQDLQERVERLILEDTGVEVEITLQGGTISPAYDNDGLAFTASLGTVFLLTMLGVSFIPHLMLEEKRNRTLDALLVSPASSSMVVAAKALTGLSYAVILGLPSLMIYGSVIVHWDVAVLALLTCGLFTISVGLLLGTLLNNRAQLMAWAWVAVIPMMIPPFLVVLEELIPAGLISLARWVPTVAASLLIRASAAAEIPTRVLIQNLGILVAGCAAMLALDAYIVQRRDR